MEWVPIEAVHVCTGRGRVIGSPSCQGLQSGVSLGATKLTAFDFVHCLVLHRANFQASPTDNKYAVVAEDAKKLTTTT
jgi:hypothetical protein